LSLNSALQTQYNFRKGGFLMIVIITRTGVIRGSYVDKNIICRHDSLTEKIANLAEGKRVAIVSSHTKNAEETAGIFKDEYQINTENISVLNDHSLKPFLDDSKKTNVEILIVELDEKPYRHFPKLFSENYLKRVVYMEAFKNGHAWMIDLDKNTIAQIEP